MSAAWSLSGWHVVVVFAAALAGGMVNAIAGGGSVITFPTLVFIGINPILANATSTVGIWPASVAAAHGFRREIGDAPRAMLWLLFPSVVGGAIGALVLLHTPTHIFSLLAPYLVLVASVLLASQRAISRRIRSDPEKQATTKWWVAAVLAQGAVAVYGGFFGAGIGILMLATLGLIGLTDIHRMNGLKNLYAAAINGAAIIYFVISRAVVWSVVGVMVLGTVAGGVAGAYLAHRVGRESVRRIIVGIGITMTGALLARLYL